ncbi:MAG: ABC transporter ATP-binding protein, partial [Thermoanaerobaculia bacterium]|nr:ABC transporter ATP-binding protein [Thermoanaerobaculia bacterium]
GTALSQADGVRLSRLFKLVRPYRVRWIFGLIGVVIGSLLSLAGAKMWTYLVNAISGPEAAINGLSALNFYTLLTIGVFVASSFFSFVSGYLLSVVGLQVTVDLRMLIYRHLQRLSLAFFTERRTGELVSRVMSDTMAVRNVLTGEVSALLGQVVIFVGALVMIITINWQLMLLMLLIVPVVSVVSTFLGRAIRRLSKDVTDEYALLSTHLEETVSGIRVVRSFVREAYEIARFRSRLVSLLTLAVKRIYLQILFGPLMSAFFFTSTIVIVWFGGRQVLAGKLTVGDLVTFIFVTGQLGGSIRFVGGMWTRLQEALGSSQRLFELLDVKSDVTDAPDARVLPPIEGRLCFDRVSFAYGKTAAEGEPKRVLQDISIEIQPGEVLAVVGPSGAGKTTLFNLVPRFYDPIEGAVLLDGHDLRGVKLDSLREQIGVVPQEAHLFGGTIRENLRYGRLDATEEEVIEAARAANAHDFILASPQGYDTVVGERGMRLSGGQRQRLAIARAVLKNPRLLLLDEATSALDSESERLVQEALDRLMKGRTTLVIAHRLSTVKNADRIAVLDEGKLVELGKHDELLANDGLYARLYRQQFREELVEISSGQGENTP